jgi:hypothetical protein
LRFFLKLLSVFAKIVIITLVFEKNTKFFAENWQKSQKFVIITSTPGWVKERNRPEEQNIAFQHCMGLMSHGGNPRHSGRSGFESRQEVFSNAVVNFYLICIYF